MLLISSILYKPQQASANPLVGAAVPAGITIGAGAYTVGALGLAGILGIAGYAEYEEEINAHAKRVWEGSTDLAKDSLEWSLDAAREVGNTVSSLNQGFNEWLDSVIDAYATDVSQLYIPEVLPNEVLDNLGAIPVHAGITLPDGHEFVAKRNGEIYRFKSIYKGRSFNRITFRMGVYQHNIATYIHEGDDYAEFYETITSLSQFYNLASANIAGNITSFYISNIEDAQYQEAIGSKIREQWETTRDAGLVLPVNDAIPMSGNIGLTYNPANDTYHFPSGELWDGTIHDPIDWAFPTPQIVTDSITGNDVVAFPTRAPAITDSKGNVIPGELTGDFTNVFTGEPVITGNPPVDVTGFWATLWQWLQKILNAILSIPQAILSGLAALFVPTLSLSEVVGGLVGTLEEKFTMPSEFIPILSGTQSGGYCVVDDMKVNVMGKQSTIFKSDFLLRAADWYIPIFRGLLWFLFAWYCVRKFIGIWNKVGGVKL